MKTVKILQLIVRREKGMIFITGNWNKDREDLSTRVVSAGRKRYKSNRDFGRAGENQAVEYLDKKGYEILVQNYRCRFGELDIVAEKDGALCFIEVKTRSSVEHGAPCEFVDHRKRLHIRRCAWAFMEDMKKGRLQSHGSAGKKYDTSEALYWFRKRKWETMRIEIVEVLYRDEKF